MKNYLRRLTVLLLCLLLTACSFSRGDSSPTIRRSDRRAEDYTLDGKGRPSYPGAVLGVDVSAHQREIDWERAKADGVAFAILRIGFRGNTEGGLMADERFAANYVGARHAGLLVGVYFYSQATSEAEALEEADYVLRLLDGVPLDLPVFFDWEEVAKGRTGGFATSAVSVWAQSFCRRIAEGGYRSGVYFNQRYGYSIMRLENLTEYAFWIAEYADDQSFAYQTDFWQFTGSGHVDGIDTIVDLDLMYAPEETHEEDQ
jgi:GH25 family lysozyme M1 (1,4-beta-N-acetylmuramidase)